MSTQLLLGPVLGFENGGYYTVLVVTDVADSALRWNVDGRKVPLKAIATLHAGTVYRGEFKPASAAKGRWVAYQLQSKGSPLVSPAKTSSWQFWIPGAKEEPKIAYCSCNGFSSLKLMNGTPNAYALWERMAVQHAAEPYGLLLMGGDQVYADGIWENGGPPTLSDWSHLEVSQRIKRAASPTMIGEIERYYEDLYLQRWSRPALAAMLASIPSVMMWDDHDIFDGWGSFPDDQQNCPVFKAVFAGAKRVFESLQLRGATQNRNRLGGTAALTLRLNFGAYYLLVLDNRSERSQLQIMSDAHWSAVKSELSALKTKRFLVMSGVPVVYRSFASIESIFGVTGDIGDMEDDILDHWSARPHQQERRKLISILLDTVAANAGCRAAILSGDVHVGGVGMIYDAARELEIYQIISSGVVHPPPSLMQWLGIKALTSDEKELLGNGDVSTEMLTADGAGEVIRDRNFARLHWGTDGKLWINWECEKEKTKPSFAIGPVLNPA